MLCLVSFCLGLYIGFKFIKASDIHRIKMKVRDMLDDKKDNTN